MNAQVQATQAYQASAAPVGLAPFFFVLTYGRGMVTMGMRGGWIKIIKYIFDSLY